MLHRITSSRMLLLAVIAAVLGVLGGFAAWLLLHLIGLFTNFALFHRFGWSLPPFRHLHRSVWLVLEAIAGGLIVAPMAKWAPRIRGHGIPETMEAVLSGESRISLRTGFAKPVSAAVAIGTGGPFGAEGPIIVAGGAMGSLIGQVVAVSPSERKVLLACGASAGMAGTFGSPLAAVMLAIELLLFEFSARALVPLIVASALAAGVHYQVIAKGPLFPVPPQHYAGLGKLPYYAILGLACGLAAVVINEGMFLFEAGYRRLPVPEFWLPVIGAAAFGLVGLITPRALGVGYDAIGDVLLGKLAAGALAVLCVTKLLAWWVALASTTSGGTIAPLLLISGTFGSLVGRGLGQVFPSAHLSASAFALVAMAATFGAAVDAPLTGILFIFEITRDYHAILPLMLATVLATLVTGAMTRESLMTEKPARHGMRVGTRFRPDVLATESVGAVMDTDVQTIGYDACIGDARRTFRGGDQRELPVVDGEGGCVGIVTRSEVFEADADDQDPLAGMVNTEVPGVAPDAGALEAIRKLLETSADALPVLDSGQVVGMFVLGDVLRVRADAFREEQVQSGWRPAWLRRRRGADDPGTAPHST